MLISERFIYLELPKTACSHIRDLLKLLAGGSIDGKHNRLPANLTRQNKYILGSIRNPWDWYVSLWAFGCDGKGSLYKRLARSKFGGNRLSSLRKNGIAISPLYLILISYENLKKSNTFYEVLYSDSKNPDNFRKWLEIILDQDSNKKYTFGDGYALSPISSYAGIYTYYYLQLFSSNITNLYNNTLQNENDLKRFDKENNILDFVIRTENLNADLLEFVKKIGCNLDEEIIESFKPHWHKNKDTNTNSSSRVKDLGYYYDKKSIDLVADREKFIIQKYNYAALEVEHYGLTDV